ncbi:uncharacterized protein E0L32_005562 [Thyridium curvatum]|uniref:U3 small nucleolar RNA-associated protein 10 n=1 Tax=Thyridium curvatum TaxID=1093900 RepID=A0A507B5J5_9PEZI|nr:uncharacterized protein E0L32_005562 [Thyridium curvatum]TPX14366.1 hypothetical protein E0L32_005562 [Thyridium curvatum]
MATSLAAQLAQIAASSKSTLNIKAQKAAHSKSLIFEPRVAASQNYQTIYTLCYEGFEELCQLDSRFAQFSTTIFSEQSQDEDRTQMTAAENAELDKKVESFLRLAGSRLRLMPTIKSIEWLIRRFRIHEFNTSALIATFLPYHSIPAFLTLMSILPANLPQEFRFLDPYVKSLTALPRAAIVQQAINHSELLSAISTYTLESCRSQQHYPALISFWGGIMTEAVNGMLDKMRSGRRSVQLDHDQVILQQIGPTLADAMVMRKVPGVQIAAYMVVAVFVAKSSLDDTALSAFMEQLVLGWTQETVRPGLVCLAILAQYRSAKQLSSKVTKAMMKIHGLPDLLNDLAKDHQVEKLANGLVLALTDRLCKKGDARGVPVIKSILMSSVLQERQIVVVFKSLLVAAHKITDDVDESGQARKQLGSALVILSQATGDVGDVIRKVIEDADFDIEELELKLDATIRPRRLLEASKADIDNGGDDDEGETPQSLETALEQLSKVEHSRTSCLSQASDAFFGDLCKLLISVAADKGELLKFDTAPLLCRSTAGSTCFYLSFYMRVWMGPYPTLARVAALDLAKDRLKQDDLSGADLQALLPYCIAAMNDTARKVRRAAADLLVVLGQFPNTPKSKGKKQAHWGSDQLYEKSDDLKWLTPEASNALLQAILPSLEEAVLDADHLTAVLKELLNGSSSSSTITSAKEKKSHVSHAARSAILTFLASHVIYSPLLTLKIRVLKALNQVRGVSSTSRTQLLQPLLQWWGALKSETAQELCALEAVDENTMDLSCVDVVVPNDKAGLDCLFDIAKSSISEERPNLVSCVFARIQNIWPAMKAETKFLTAQTLIDLAYPPQPSAETDVVSQEAAELLRNVDLTTEILSSFLDALQDSSRMLTDPPPNKRRRTSSSEQNRGINVQATPEFKSLLSKVTFVLQLVEAAKPAEHPELLQSLFITLSDLQTLRALVGSELGYLQNLVLSSLLAMLPAYRDNKELKIDASVGHGDILVNCIQKSASPAVQNSALLLVASLAKTAPDVVLHSVMPIFTFMGGSVLRQSDDYSAHVINQTIQEVVPPLIESFKKGRRNLLTSASELLSSFVIAYEHIPSPRRRDLFISLIKNLGPEDFLFAMAAMFVDKYGTTDSIIAFVAELMGAFPVQVQLQSLVKLVDLVSDTLKPKPTLSAILLSKKEDGEQDLQKSALKALTLLPQLLTSRTLKAEFEKLAEADDMETAKVRELYALLLEDVLMLADTVKSKKTMYSRCGAALSSLLNLLSIGEFIKAVESLLDRPNVGLRQKVLRALEVRVDGESTSNPKSRAVLLAFLPQLTAVIRESDDIHYKHTAVTCVDKIAEKYGKKDLEAVAGAAASIAGDECLGQSDRRLQVMALLCLASLVDVLHDAIVPVLPKAMPKALSYLELSLSEPDSELHNAAYSFITSLTQSLPYIMSGSYLNQLLAVSDLSAEADLDTEANESRRECLQTVASQVEAKSLLTGLEKNWQHATESGFLAIDEFIYILGRCIDKHTKSVVAKNVGTLSSIFLSLFDLRRQKQVDGDCTAAELTKLTETEHSVNSVALKMIYKLNDAAFRPVFAQLLEWTTTGLSQKKDRLGRALRQRSVYGFLYTFFDNLKSIVTSYASYVVDSAVDILRTSNPKSPHERELWRLVVRTLAKSFEHDQDGFWQAPSHFEAVAPALVAQLLHAAGPSADDSDVAAELAPALAELAAAADSQEHQKDLNTAILKHMRAEAAPVRLAAVRCQQALTDRLGEEWLAMLPEMLPYISELQDDDDEVVDRETHRWIVKIEEVLGESLDSMLQ